MYDTVRFDRSAIVQSGLLALLLFLELRLFSRPRMRTSNTLLLQAHAFLINAESIIDSIKYANRVKYQTCSRCSFCHISIVTRNFLCPLTESYLIDAWASWKAYEVEEAIARCQNSRFLESTKKWTQFSADIVSIEFKIDRIGSL